ncbi:type VII toxin-antitoxin system MntA family adenylyltransferase antitoxin [Alteribacter aurantiacus]|uniref:type VII toxin-antitoxin system MntA family adenylyltransferase antitoxin n=1 Tax=Alteribacter aurantiacus TaxID=254410 RepID=UPI000411A48B|nr:nucleotidyltransferase domain-containing protein [Alteribacter aurantiacus]
MLDGEKEIIINVLKNSVSPYVIYVFGSTVNGETHNKSDLDLAFLSDNKVCSPYDLFMIAQTLADKVNREVDLVDLKKASTVFRAQVIHTGTAIYCSDEYKRQRFEMVAFNMYAKLNEERASILNRINESGTVYEK